MRSRALRATLLASLAVLAACDVQVPPRTQTTSTPNITFGSGSAAPSGGLGFRDDFDGQTLDESHWISFQQSGLITLKDGQVELLNTGRQPNFPYMLSRSSVIPQDGPWFLEIKFSYLMLGAVSFALDHLPAEAPGEEALTKPFLLVTSRSKFTFTADIEGNTDPTTFSPEVVEANKDYLLRVEGDSQGHNRVILDGREVLLFETTRRPSRFWIGQNPPKDVAPQTWPRILIDYVATGVLAAPASAEPYVAPTPKPTPTPKPKPTPTPAPSASPEASASPGV